MFTIPLFNNMNVFVSPLLSQEREHFESLRKNYDRLSCNSLKGFYGSALSFQMQK